MWSVARGRRFSLAPLERGDDGNNLHEIARRFLEAQARVRPNGLAPGMSLIRHVDTTARRRRGRSKRRRWRRTPRGASPTRRSPNRTHPFGVLPGRQPRPPKGTGLFRDLAGASSDTLSGAKTSLEGFDPVGLRVSPPRPVCPPFRGAQGHRRRGALPCFRHRRPGEVRGDIGGSLPGVPQHGSRAAEQ